MDVTYFKRYRMEIGLIGRDFSRPPMPEGYRFVPWSDSALDDFSAAKYLSFRDEIDTNVFPCLGELAGCRRLMREISRKPGFLPEATWLLAHTPPGSSAVENCGTVQGIRSRSGLGAIQNLGIARPHRDAGLGTSLLFRSLDGFRQAGLKRVYLEVTAQNDGAIRLYRRLGFKLIKTVFKAVETVHS